MDGKGNNRGAYAQVTAPIGDDPKVTIQQGGKSGGMCSSCTPKRLGIAIAAAILLIILIIVIVVISTKNNNGPKAVKGNTTATEASRVSPEMVTTKHLNPSISSMTTGVTVTTKHLNPSMSSMTTGVTTPTQPPTMKATTTLGPAVIGNFDGTFVMDKAYGTYFDDGRAPATTAFMANFTGAMNEVYNATIAKKYLYEETLVTQLVQNGTYVQVRFTVSLNAINRGGRDYLVNTLGSFPSNALNTYPVLYADIEPEKDSLTNA